MKKKMLTILTLVITFNSLLLSTVYTVLVQRQYASFIDRFTEDVIHRVEQQTVNFERIIATIEEEVVSLGCDGLLAAYHSIEKVYDEPFEVTGGFLDSLVFGSIFDHFYVIDNNGIIVTTTLEADQGLDLFSTGAVMERLLKRVYGEGKAISQGLSISNMTGTKRIFFYFSPRGEDWILEASVNIENYVATRYSHDYADFLFSDFFVSHISNESFLKDLDLYSKTSISSWSLIKKGKELGDKDIIRDVSESGKSVRKEGDILRIYLPVVLESMNSPFMFKQNLIAELVFDVSLFSRIKRMTYIISCLVFLLCTVVFSFVASSLIDKRFIHPLEDLKNVLRKAAEGDYSPRVETETNIDEIGKILESTNHLLGLISDREEKLTLRTDELNRSLKQKELLLMEIHHRVKNNLQIMASLLSLQQSLSEDNKSSNSLRNSINRLHAMASVHEALYGTEHFGFVDFSELLPGHINNILRSFDIDEHTCDLDIRMECGALALDMDISIPCVLIITELVSNSIKHQKADGPSRPYIGIRMERKNDTCLLVVSDNGGGLSPEFDPGKSTTLGLTLVNNLVLQMNGTVSFAGDEGLIVTITFPAPPVD